MYWNRFDIVEGWYLALVECHGGQWSDEYLRLCRIGEYFQPGACFGIESLSENGLEIYENAVQQLLGDS